MCRDLRPRFLIPASQIDEVSLEGSFSLLSLSRIVEVPHSSELQTTMLKHGLLF